MSTLTYPQSPVNLPKNLTKLTAAYQFKATLAILGILLFFSLYGLLVLSLGYLIYYAASYDMFAINKLTILLKIGAIAGSVMLFLFTLKFIFKLKNIKPTNRIKLNKNEHTELWAFVNQICKETGAPKPKAIYVDPDVNAYVAYSNLWLSLIFPTRKELTIGLGLVSCLNMSEFKAVVSHEFGHFAQRSMKIGSYIISANTIIHDMIFSRDKWDEMLVTWRSSDIRLSAAAWIITPVIWIIRQVLALFYQFLNLMYSSLSREMEFNADKVAVSTSGSDAIISALWKLNSGAANWNTTLNSAYLAAQKNMYVQNLYIHNQLAKEREEEHLMEQFNNLPYDERGGKRYFTNSETAPTGMYASHPANNKREDNAKSPFIECEQITTSPWVLFSNVEALQIDVTALIYHQYLNKKQENFASIEDFESFVVAETLDKGHLDEYLNTFENRFLHIAGKDDLEKEASLIENDYSTKLANLKLELKELMEPIKEVEALMMKAEQMAQGAVKDKSITFQGETFKKKRLQQGYEKLAIHRDKLFNESFIEWDIAFCANNLKLAKSLKMDEELLKLYQQHSCLSILYKAIVKVKNSIIEELNRLQSIGDVTQVQVNAFGDKVNKWVFQLNDELSKLDTMNFVALPNIDTISELKMAVIEGGEFEKEPGRIFENGGFDKIMQRLETAIVHCQRIDQKNVAAILGFHKSLEMEEEMLSK